MKKENDFLPKKINEALLIGTILQIPFGIFTLCMLYWLIDSETPREAIYIMVFVISVIFFIIPLCLHIFRIKFWLKKYPNLKKKC